MFSYPKKYFKKKKKVFHYQLQRHCFHNWEEAIFILYSDFVFFKDQGCANSMTLSGYKHIEEQIHLSTEHLLDTGGGEQLCDSWRSLSERCSTHADPVFHRLPAKISEVFFTPPQFSHICLRFVFSVCFFTHTARKAAGLSLESEKGSLTGQTDYGMEITENLAENGLFKVSTFAWGRTFFQYKIKFLLLPRQGMVSTDLALKLKDITFRNSSRAGELVSVQWEC